MAITWLRKIAFNNNKTNIPAAFFMAREIQATVHNEGAVKDLLKAYIDIALDQIPFSRFIKRKRQIVTKSIGTRAAKKLEWWEKKNNKLGRKRRKRTNRFLRQGNVREYRDSLRARLRLLTKKSKKSKGKKDLQAKKTIQTKKNYPNVKR